MGKARRQDERRLALSRLGHIQAIESLRAAAKFIGDREVGNEAVAAVLAVAEAFQQPSQEERDILVRSLRRITGGMDNLLGDLVLSEDPVTAKAQEILARFEMPDLDETAVDLPGFD